MSDQAGRVLPETLHPRELLALPLYVVIVLLYVLAACLALTADAIAGKQHSFNLFEWRLS
jgi:hypothetical protein